MGLDVLGGVGGGAVGGVSTGGNTAGNTGTVGNQIVLVGGSNITLSQGTAAGGLATVTIVGAGGSFSAGVSTGGNSAGTTGTVSNGVRLYGGANITLSQSSGAGGATVTIVGNAGAGAFQGGVSTGGNTSGNTKTVASQIVFVGGNNVTLSQATNGASATITISGPSGGGAGMSTQGNTAGTTGTVGMELIFVGGSNITLSQSVNGSSASLTIIGASGGSGAAPTFYHYPTVPLGAVVWGNDPQGGYSGSTSANAASTHSTMSYFVQPLAFDGNIVASDIMEYLKVTVQTSITTSGTIRDYFGLYTLTGSTLSLASSWMGGLCWSVNSDSISHLAYTGSDSGSIASGTTGSAGLNVLTGSKFGPLARGAATTFAAGQYFGVHAQHIYPGQIQYAWMMKTVSANLVGNVTAQTTIWQPLNGVFSSSSSTNVAGANQWLMPSSVATSAITATGYNQQLRPIVFFRGM